MGIICFPKNFFSSPEEVVKSAGIQGLDIIAEVKLGQEANRLKYLISGTKKERFMAVFGIYLSTTLVYDTDNGVLEKVEQTTLIKIADLLSF